MLFYTHYIDQFCKSAANFMITKIFKDKKFNLFENSSVFCLFLFDVKFLDDDLEKIET